MKIEIGKLYKNRKGDIIGPMTESCYPVQDHTGTAYAADGKYYAAHDGSENEKDLVEEYIEPKPVQVWGVIDTQALVVVATFKYLHHASTFANAMKQQGGSYNSILLSGELK